MIAIICMMLSLILSACGKEPEAPEKITKQPSYEIDDLPLRDSRVIYNDDDEDSVVTMYLTVMPGNETDRTNHTWKEINSYSAYYYQEKGVEKYRVAGLLQVGDEKGPVPGKLGYGDFYPNCVVQIRGQSNSVSPQKSYKIELEKNKGLWRDQRTINLNKHVFDVVRFRNKLSYDLLKTIPNAFSARTQFVHLYVRDMTDKNASDKFQDYGLYTHVEQINKTYLRNHGLDPNGQLYKATMFEFFRYEDVLKLSSDPDYDKAAFEKRLEIKGNNDHEKLLAMLDDVNNYSIPIETVMDTYFDEENYLTWLAFQIITGNEDTMSQNFYLYSPQHGNKWYFISWDNDAAWTYQEDVNFRNMGDPYRYMLGASRYWGSVLHQRVLKSEELRDKLTQKVEELYQLITRQRVEELVNTYVPVVEPYLYSMPDLMYAPLKKENFDWIVSHIADEMDYRREFYYTSLRYPMPFFTGLPMVSGDKMIFNWDLSYDLQGEKVTYTFELSRDYEFKNVIVKKSGLEITSYQTDALKEPGQYFIRVTATDESGNSQSAMEIYRGEDRSYHYGVLPFYVDENGEVYSD